jgi:hypothetical protein
MKTLIISTLTAAALALSAGTALASDRSPDNGFAIYLQDQGKAPVADRSFLSGTEFPEDVYNPPNGNNNRDAREFRAAQKQHVKPSGERSFLTGGGSEYYSEDVYNPPNGKNNRDARDFRATQATAPHWFW